MRISLTYWRKKDSNYWRTENENKEKRKPRKLVSVEVNSLRRAADGDWRPRRKLKEAIHSAVMAVIGGGSDDAADRSDSEGGNEDGDRDKEVEIIVLASPLVLH